MRACVRDVIPSCCWWCCCWCIGATVYAWRLSGFCALPAFSSGCCCCVLLLLHAAQDEGGTAAANPLRIPNDRRQVIRGRVEQMRLHPSFNRRFRSPFTSKASWQIEECARALQCFLPVCFRPVRRGSSKEEVLQPDLAKKAYGHLKRFAAFHLGHEGFDTQQEYVAAAIRAHQELLEYGKLVEQVCLQAYRCRLKARLLYVGAAGLGFRF